MDWDPENLNYPEINKLHLFVYVFIFQISDFYELHHLHVTINSPDFSLRVSVSFINLFLIFMETNTKWNQTADNRDECKVALLCNIFV